MGAAWQSSPTLCYFFTRTFTADLNSVAAVIWRKPAVIPPVFYIARNLSANPLGLLSSSRQTRWSRTTGNVQKKKKKVGAEHRSSGASGSHTRRSGDENYTAHTNIL